jgi:hypothetical protein
MTELKKTLKTDINETELDMIEKIEEKQNLISK